MMTDVQGAALLALFSGVAPSEAYRGKRVAVALWSNGWIDGFHEVTAAGRDALARWLLRSFFGSRVWVAPEQPPAFADEARTMLAILVKRLPVAGGGHDLFHLRRLGWIDAVDPAPRLLTALGREALACWLLRGLK